MLTRRDLVRSGALAAGSLGLAPAFFRSARAAAAPARPGPGPYGPLGPPDANGIRLPEGFSSRVIATGNSPILGTDYGFPLFPDGAATYATPDGGWILAVNSEVPSGQGGASAIRFAPDGTITDAYRILGGTSTNCAGGATPWGTWMSCEEVEDGQVWECDPTGATAAVAHPAMGVFNHEAVAVDPVHERLYLTEDEGDGGFYRFTPREYPDCSQGLLEVAVVGKRGRVRWVAVPDPLGGAANPTRRQVEEMTKFKRGEGIAYAEGIVYVATTSDSVVHAYDTTTERISRLYDRDAVENPPLVNPDNVTLNRAGEVFVGEDDGGDDPLDLCVITPEGEVARFLKLTGTQHGSGDAMSEVTGPTFDPSGTRLYFSSQRAFVTGQVYEISGPFRTTPRQVQAPGQALGVETPRRVKRARLLRKGLPVALTLDAPAEVTVTVTAKLRPRPGRPRRRVRIARYSGTVDAGTTRLRVRPRRPGSSPLRRRRKPLRAKVVVQVGEERATHRLRIT